MTVKTQLQQAIAGAESLSGQLKGFALETQQPAVKEMFDTMSQQLEDMLPRLKGRLQHVEDEEPQLR